MRDKKGIQPSACDHLCGREAFTPAAFPALWQVDEWATRYLKPKPGLYSTCDADEWLTKLHFQQLARRGVHGCVLLMAVNYNSRSGSFGRHNDGWGIT